MLFMIAHELKTREINFVEKASLFMAHLCFFFWVNFWVFLSPQIASGRLLQIQFLFFLAGISETVFWLQVDVLNPHFIIISPQLTTRTP
jgi:hypothetical protein